MLHIECAAPDCSVEFRRKYRATGEKRYCSTPCYAAARCGVRRTPEQMVERREMYYKSKCRRRRLRVVETWDGVPDSAIFERDRWRCQIQGCARPIEPELSYPHPMSASVDHVLPLSEGGDDTAANKRASHLRCNVLRGNRGGGEQLAMFG